MVKNPSPTIRTLLHPLFLDLLLSLSLWGEGWGEGEGGGETAEGGGGGEGGAGKAGIYQEVPLYLFSRTQQFTPRADVQMHATQAA